MSVFTCSVCVRARAARGCTFCRFITELFCTWSIVCTCVLDTELISPLERTYSFVRTGSIHVNTRIWIVVKFEENERAASSDKGLRILFCFIHWTFFSFRPSTLTACGRKSVGWGIVALYQADFVRIPSGIIDVIQYEIVMNRGLWLLRPVVPDNDFLIFFVCFYLEFFSFLGIVSEKSVTCNPEAVSFSFIPEVGMQLPEGWVTRHVYV